MVVITTIEGSTVVSKSVLPVDKSVYKDLGVNSTIGSFSMMQFTKKLINTLVHRY